jgi:hypothetical protein
MTGLGWIFDAFFNVFLTKLVPLSSKKSFILVLMRMNLVSKILTGTIMASVAFPASLFAEANQGNTKGIVDTKLVASWNRTAKNWPTLKTPSDVDREMKKMKISYNPRFEMQDKKFIDSLVSQLSEFPIVKVKGDAYECFDKKSGTLLFTAKVLGNNKYSFNGRDFEYDMKATLESNVSRIKDLVMNEKVSFLDQALLPQAYAMKPLAVVAISIGAAILVGSTIFNKGENITQGWNKVTRGVKDAGAGILQIPTGIGTENPPPHK